MLPKRFAVAPAGFLHEVSDVNESGNVLRRSLKLWSASLSPMEPARPAGQCGQNNATAAPDLIDD